MKLHQLTALLKPSRPFEDTRSPDAVRAYELERRNNESLAQYEARKVERERNRQWLQNLMNFGRAAQ